MIISSKYNSKFKDILKLNDKKYRKDRNLFLVEGIKLVNECLAVGFEVEYLICTEKFADNYQNPIVVTDELFLRISSEKTPQGVMAVTKIPIYGLTSPQNSCILLDRLQDPGNVGTIIRTANAAGYGEIYMINCTDPYSPKAVRASMGGVFFTKIYQGDEDEILHLLQDVPIVCADMNGENIFTFTPPKKFCLCIGNEGSGINGSIAAAANYKVKIPMKDTCESLNAAVSAGIAMYVLKDYKVR